MGRCTPIYPTPFLSTQPILFTTYPTPIYYLPPPTILSTPNLPPPPILSYLPPPPILSYPIYPHLTPYPIYPHLTPILSTIYPHLTPILSTIYPHLTPYPIYHLPPPLKLHLPRSKRCHPSLQEGWGKFELILHLPYTLTTFIYLELIAVIVGLH